MIDLRRLRYARGLNVRGVIGSGRTALRLIAGGLGGMGAGGFNLRWDGGLVGLIFAGMGAARSQTQFRGSLEGQGSRYREVEALY